MARRKIIVRGLDRWATITIGALAGAGVIVDGNRPTGQLAVDLVVTVAVCLAVTWAASSAPWWALAGAAGIATAIATPVAPVALGAAVVTLALAVGATRRSQPVERAAIAGATIVVFALAQELRWFGMNSLVAVATMGVVAWLGAVRRPRTDRRAAAWIAIGACAVTAIGLVGLVIAAASARPDLSNGNRLARQGLRELKSAEFDEAGTAFRQAAAAFERANADLDAPWAAVSRILPIASQHRRTGADLSGAVARAATTLAIQVEDVDLDALRIVNGRIDIDAVAALREPMAELGQAITDLDSAIADIDTAWLAPSVTREIDDLIVEVADQIELAERASTAIDLAPSILGADGRRVYFLMFTTPGEARGQGGFMGYFAELTVEDGRIGIGAAGRPVQLSRDGDAVRTVTGPDDWLARYGPFGFETGPGGTVGRVPWSNITMSPHFPSTAQVVAELYPQSGGRPIDGVISMDVFALEALVDVLGPLDVDAAPKRLNGMNTAEFLLRDQYEIADVGERFDLLADVAQATLTALISTNPPDPLDFGKALAPMAGEQRVMTWSPRAAEQEMIERVGLDGSLLSGLEENDGIAVTVVNASANKIDSFLARDHRYRAAVGPDGRVSGDLQFTFHNDAPTSGLPDYLIQNLVGLPTGWSRLYITIHSTIPISNATLDGAPLGLHPLAERGVTGYAFYADVPPGGSATVAAELDGRPRSEPFAVLVEPQPLVADEQWTVTVTDGDDVATIDRVLQQSVVVSTDNDRPRHDAP